MAGRVANLDVSGDVRIPIKALLLTPTPSLPLHLVLHPTAIYRVTDMPPKAKTTKKRARSPATTKAAGDKSQTRSSKRTKKDASVAAADETKAQVSNIPRLNNAFSACSRRVFDEFPTPSDDMNAGGRRRGSRNGSVCRGRPA